MILINKRIILLLFSIGFFLLSCDDDSELCIDKFQIDRDAICPMVYDPVCGCNGLTYSNDCEAKKSGLKIWIQGACSGPRKTPQ